MMRGFEAGSQEGSVVARHNGAVNIVCRYCPGDIVSVCEVMGRTG